MSDKLLIEIDMFNGELGDVIPALIYLANELVESGTIEISRPVNWSEKKGNSYQVKWRFSEDELNLPFDIDFAQELKDELNSIKPNIPENKPSAIKDLLKQLEERLSESRISLLADAY